MRAAEALREGAVLRRAVADRRAAAPPAETQSLAALEGEAARILGAAPGGGRGGRGGSAAGGSPTIASVSALLATALEVSESADRVPPATAYEIARQASRELVALLATWQGFRDSRMKDAKLAPR